MPDTHCAVILMHNGKKLLVSVHSDSVATIKYGKLSIIKIWLSKLSVVHIYIVYSIVIIVLSAVTFS